MPTWRWWFSNKFLSKNKMDVPNKGMNASFTWEDAYIGGSCLKISGSTPEEYLHIFKTGYNLKAGDEIILCYKIQSGEGNVALTFELENEEKVIEREIIAINSSKEPKNKWNEIKYVVSPRDDLDEQTVSIIGLKFSETSDLNFLLGNFSIVKGSYKSPEMPDDIKVKILRNTSSGIDAKIIFNVPNNKLIGSVCYNDEVNASMFKIWAQEEGKEMVLTGITTTWAAMSYSTPFEGDVNGTGKIRFGVSSVSMDTQTDSEILWSEYLPAGAHIYSYEIDIDKKTITPGEKFCLYAKDTKQEFKWSIFNSSDYDHPIEFSDGAINSWHCEGLEFSGFYDLMISESTDNEERTILFENYIIVSDENRGRTPKILSLKANGEEHPIEVKPEEEICLSYKGRNSDGTISRGLAIDGKAFGVKVSEVLPDTENSFSIAGWLKIDAFPGPVNFIDIVRPDGLWPRNNWGWLWSSINPDGTMQNFDMDFSLYDEGTSTRTINYNFGNHSHNMFNQGRWSHFALIFERDKNQIKTSLYINGTKIKGNWVFTNYDYNGKVESIKEGSGEEFIPVFKEISEETLIVIGGTRHPGRGVGGYGLKGVLDDFQIWDKAMSHEDVIISMNGLNGENLPDGVAAYWDFEKPPTENYKFKSHGRSNCEAGYFQLLSTELEGQGLVSFLPPSFAAGSPFVSEHGYQVTTETYWDIPDGEIFETYGNDIEGFANLYFLEEGEEFTAQLTLTNEFGSDTRLYKYIIVKEEAGINDIFLEPEIKLYLGKDEILIESQLNLPLEISLIGLDGTEKYKKSFNSNLNDLVHIPLNEVSGIYVVKISSHGKLIQSRKIIKR